MHLSNNESHIYVTESGIIKETNDEHSSNASFPMLSTESGISI